MTDSVKIWAPGTRFIDSSGNVLAGGSVEFYDAGTSDAKTVHSDSDLITALGSVVYLDAGGAPVSESGGSTKVDIYVGTDPYKVIIKNSSGVILETKDNCQGAFDSASILANISIIAETEVVTVTTDTTLTIDERGNLYNVNTTGAQVVMTLPDATGIANGTRYGFRMAGTDPTKALVIKTTSTQTIGGSGVASTALSLTKLGEEIWVVADGGNWLQDGYAPPLMSTVGIIEITDRLTAPPGSEPAGARYIISGSPTGGWSSFAQHDIVEADGQSGWRRFIPATDCGWTAYVKDEDLFYFFRGSAWAAETATSTVPGTVKVSTQAIMEAATATDTAVLVGHQHFHPGMVKAWGYVTVDAGTPTLVSSYNVASITDTAVGKLTVTIDNDLSSGDYSGHVTCQNTAESTSSAARKSGEIEATPLAAGSIRFGCYDGDDDPSDPLSWHFLILGDM